MQGMQTSLLLKPGFETLFDPRWNEEEDLNSMVPYYD
jgi:hypothetical protein